MSEAATIIRLPGRCVFNEVNTVWAQYLAAEGTSVAIDARDVIQVDMAGLQVVVAIVRDMSRQERPVRWVGRSDEFNACAELGGLSRHLAA